MALRVQKAEKRSRSLRVVPNPDVPGHDAPEEFAYPSRAVAVPVLGVRRLVKRLVVLAVVVIAVAFGVQRFTAHKTPRGVATRASASASAQRVPASAAAADPVTGVPMSVVTTALHPDAATHTFQASVTVRNPTDLVAADVKVEATLKDASGNVILTVSKSLDSLASGQVSDVDFSGELDPQASVPAAIDLNVVAARLVS